jgi:GNAT superfamily N-acetyltransferase
MPVNVRPAVTGDHRFIAEMIYESMLPVVGRGMFDAALEGTGVDPVAFHEVLLLNEASNWGQLDSFFVLEDEDGKPGGVMGAYFNDQPDLRPLTAEGFERVVAKLNWSKEMAQGFWRKYVSFFGFFGTAPQLQHPGEYILEFGAVRPDLRGRLLYRHMVNAHIARAKERGYKSVGSTGVAGNLVVERAMGRLGFEVRARFGPEHYRGMFPGMVRLVYDIPQDR